MSFRHSRKSSSLPTLPCSPDRLGPTAWGGGVGHIPAESQPIKLSGSHGLVRGGEGQVYNRTFAKAVAGQAQWLTPVTPALWEA
ncbi:hypothetical protein AAY473_032788 [Plecturocebus cupreus]